MKNKASTAVKNMISVLSSIVKAKIMGVKSKANSMRVRLLVFSLLKSRNLSLGSLSNKIQALLDKKHDSEQEDQVEDHSKAIVLYNNAGVTSESHFDYEPSNQLQLANIRSQEYDYFDYEDDKYPDLTHSLFEEEDDGFDDQGGSVIDLVKNSKENEGEDFSLEDEIDQVADLFIKRFKKHVRLEKLESFKRYQAMLGRGV